MTDSTRGQILVATDATDHADHALVLADAWAREGDLDLTIAHVLPVQAPMSLLFPGYAGGRDADIEDLRGQVTDTLARRIETLTGRSADEYTLVVATGTPYAEIVRLSEGRPTSMIMLGARAHDGLARLFLGHTAEKVARYAHCPVFVARPGRHTGRILVATDLSEDAAVAVRAAAAYASTHDAALSAVYAVDTFMPFPLDVGSGVDAPSMRNVAKARARAELEAYLERVGVQATPIISEAPVADAIADTAEGIDAELVVVGTHGRTGLRRIALGNTAGGVLERVHCSVLVLPTPGEQAHAPH